jgi:hypothetical protein
MKAVGAKGRALQSIISRDLQDLAPQLVEYLNLPEEEAPLNFLAAEALADWGHREGIAWYIQRVDQDDNLSGYAMRVLGRTTGVNFFTDRTAWEGWWQQNQTHFPSAADSGNVP